MEYLRLLTIARDAMSSPFPIAAEVASGDDASTPPAVSPLLASVYFSRDFVPTYYIVVSVMVLVAFARYSYTTRSRRKVLNNRKSAEKQSVPTSSSASSTLVGSGVPTPKDGTTTERSSLLPQTNFSGAEASVWPRLCSRIEAFFMYQPMPIPAVTARSNHLPDNGTSAIVIIFVFVNLFYLFYNVIYSDPVSFAFTISERAALCFIVNLPVLYILGAKNNQPLKYMTGWTYEKLNLYHRRLGEWMIVLGLCHFVGMIFTHKGILQPLGYSWGWFFTLKINVLGLTALSSFLVLWVTSIGYVREKAYEFFLASHIVLQIIALVVLLCHQTSGRYFVALAIAVWIADRGISRILVSNKKFVATLELGADKDTILLYCDIPIDRSKRGDIRSGWKPGQHVFLSVPGIKWYHAFQSHPFTIGSPAPSSAADGTICQMQLIIRAMDGFSRELLEYAEFHQHTEVILDGPYGDSDLAENLLTADRVCLIAGGSGITLTYPLAWVLWTKDGDAPAVSSRAVYHQGKKRQTQILLHSIVSEGKQAHMWVRQSPAHASWITTSPKHFTGILTGPEASHCSDGVNLVSKTFETRQGYGGRPDITIEMRRWLEDGDRSINSHKQRVCFVVCGPDGLVRDVRNCTAALVREGYNIELHVEKFGW